MSSAASPSILGTSWAAGSTLVRRRFLPCLAGAVTLHAAVTLVGLRQSSVHTEASRAEAHELALIPVTVEAVEPGRGALPGGGSEEPEPEDAVEAKPELRGTDDTVPPVPQAPEQNDAVDLAERVEKDPDSDLSAAQDLLTALSGPELGRPARVDRIESRKYTRTTRMAAKQTALRSRSRGLGPGAYGGPGGPGAGWNRGGGNGVVSQQFAFGGPRGAFRAEVCFIPAWTSSLREVGQCRVQVVFFTNHLDVAPRKFNQGFPGITERTEWFAIRYRGKFRVRVSDYYKFRIVSDDGSLLHIDGHLIVDNDGQHPPAYKEATIPLEQGEHDLFVEYYQGPRDNIALQLFVSGSDGEQRLFGPVI